jgi:hypothetical protein
MTTGSYPFILSADVTDGAAEFFGQSFSDGVTPSVTGYIGRHRSASDIKALCFPRW